LDILQYNREQQKPYERVKDDEIEQLLLSHNAKNRCSIRRVVSKRKGTIDNDESVVSNLACLSIDLATNGEIQTARSHARMAASLQGRGDTNGALQSYTQAMMNTPNDTLDWATYAYNVAVIHLIHGQRQSALDLLLKAIHIRKQLEKNSEEIDQLQRAIDNVQSQIP
jgi:tetratricopeptide (TPR) repeat protein